MENKENIHYISRQDIQEIDPSKVAYMTLSDGSVFLIQDNSELNHQQESKTIESKQINTENNNNICNCNNYNRKINSNKGQFFVEQKGTRNELYKLVEAIPVRFCDIEGAFLVNQNTNLQLNFQQYNNDTYLINNTNSDNYSNYQINTQSSGSDYNNTINNKLKCTCHLGKEQFLTKKEMKCCCPIGNPEMRNKLEIVVPDIVKQY